MSDLISRQAAIDALCKTGCESGYCGVSCDDVKAIEKLPSAEVEPVKHGRWTKIGHIENTWLVSKCSECGYQTIDAGNYCPNCGARMFVEGEEDNEL